MKETITRQELLEIAKELATPIDFDGLISKGVIEKLGAWYAVLKPNELPPHAWRQATAVKTAPKGGISIKFRKPTKEFEAFYKKLASESALK